MISNLSPLLNFGGATARPQEDQTSCQEKNIDHVKTVLQQGNLQLQE